MEINVEASDNWGWRNILNLRQEVRNHLIVKLGDGSKTSMWFDIWSPVGALHRYISYMDLYDARFNARMIIREFVDDVNGQWPPEWYHKFPMITHIQQIKIVPDKSDMVMWKKNDGSWSSCRVEWSKLIWFSQNIPKHAFVLWLAVQSKLPTQDKLRK